MTAKDNAVRLKTDLGSSSEAGGTPPLRVGVIGANPSRGWGLVAHLPALGGLDEFEVAAVATTHLESAQETARAFDVPLAFDNGFELAAHPDVDVVAVTVKVPEHDALIRAALAAGKHVYSEWPLSVDASHARELTDLAERAGVRHVIGLQGWFSPGARFVRELIESGLIGEPLAASVVSSGGPAGRRIQQVMAYATQREAGATLLSISTGHLLATLEVALGSPISELSAVVAAVTKQATVIDTGETLDVTSPDQVAICARLARGLVLSVAVQGGAAPGASPAFQMRVVGADGTLTIQPAPQAMAGFHSGDWAIGVARPDGSIEDLEVPERLIPGSIPAGPARNVALAYRELGRAIRDDRPADPSFTTAVRYHELLDAIELASENGERRAVG